MYKSQLQELAQRSCFNLPSYACIREGPDHAPRFKACVNFNGELFESPTYCTTLRKAEHAAAEVALNVLSTRGPSRSLTARILDETGVYKNLLQETAHRTGLNLPVYTTIRSGPGHAPVFTSTVELAGMNFTGESAKTKKQAEKNAAIAAWCSLKKMPNLGSMCQYQTSKETDIREEQDQAVVARILSNFRPREEKKSNRPRRDDQIQNQTRRGGILNRDHHHLWRRPMDLLMDSFSEGPEQKQNSFVSLLPPPPPRTSSKILQTTSSRDNSSSLYYQYSSDHSPSSIVTGQCQSQVVKKQEVAVAPPLALDEHQKDEDEWLSGKSSSDHVMKEENHHVMKEDSGLGPNSIMYRQAFALANYSGRSRLVGTPSSSPSISPMPIVSSSIKCSPPPTRSNHIGIGGGYKYNPQRRIAPAVQIRSVIPVCATPTPSQPAPAPAVRPPQPSMKEAAATTSMSTTHRGGEGAVVVSSASPRFNKLLQVNTTQLSSDFNNKLH